MLTIVIPTGLVILLHGGRIIARRLPPQLVTVPVSLCQLPSLKNDSRTMAWVMSTICSVGGGNPARNTISQVSEQENKMVHHVSAENTACLSLEVASHLSFVL